MPGAPSVADVVTHPVRLRIVQQVAGRELTTAELKQALPDVRQATLYRHVAFLVDAGILAVVAERPVRGAVERTLALGERMAHVDHAELAQMDGGQLRTAFLTFLGEVAAGFDRSQVESVPENRDLLGFGQTPLYVDEEDLATLQRGLGELLAPFRDEAREGVRRVDLATILLPGPPRREEP